MLLACPVKRAKVYIRIVSGDSLPMPPSPPIRSTSIGCSGIQLGCYGAVIEVGIAGQYCIFNFWWRACGYPPFSFSWRFDEKNYAMKKILP